MGYHRAGFEVVGVDIWPQPRYPFKFHQGEALEWLTSEGGIAEFNAIHASPPCQAYSAVTGEHRDKHPGLVPEVRELLVETGLPYVIENVPGAPLENPVQLCGSAFGLAVQRHRLFETNFPLMAPGCAHGQMPARFDIYEHGRWIKSPVARVYGNGGGKAQEHWAEAMGIDWMNHRELVEAIPPAFTEHIGSYLMTHLEHLQREVESAA